MNELKTLRNIIEMNSAFDVHYFDFIWRKILFLKNKWGSSIF